MREWREQVNWINVRESENENERGVEDIESVRGQGRRAMRNWRSVRETGSLVRAELDKSERV